MRQNYPDFRRRIYLTKPLKTPDEPIVDTSIMIQDAPRNAARLLLTSLHLPNSCNILFLDAKQLCNPAYLLYYFSLLCLAFEAIHSHHAILLFCKSRVCAHRWCFALLCSNRPSHLRHQPWCLHCKRYPILYERAFPQSIQHRRT